MKIEEYVLDENFDKNAQESLKRFEQASKILSNYEDAIKSGQRGIDIYYYQAYYDYIKADDEHMKTFLHFIKTCYDRCNQGKYMCFGSKRKVEAFEDIQKRAEKAFNKYYDYYIELASITEKLNQEIAKYNPEDINGNLFTQLKLQFFVMNIDAKHVRLANQVEKYRSKEILPLLQECDDLLDEDNNHATNDNTFLN